MNSLVKISEAASLALHACSLLAGSYPDSMKARDMALVLCASEAHLVKVMQTLTRAGMVRSTRGPGGGFSLMRPPDEVTLLDVFEIMEGKMLEPTGCISLHQPPFCTGENCILGRLVVSVNQQVFDYFANTRLDAVKLKVPSGPTAALI